MSSSGPADDGAAAAGPVDDDGGGEDADGMGVVAGCSASSVTGGRSSTAEVIGVVAGAGSSDDPPPRSRAPAEPIRSARTIAPATSLRPSVDLDEMAAGSGSAKSSGGGSPKIPGGGLGDRDGSRPPNALLSGTELSGTQSSRAQGDASFGSSSATASLDHMGGPIPSRWWTLVARSCSPIWRRSPPPIPMRWPRG